MVNNLGTSIVNSNITQNSYIHQKINYTFNVVTKWQVPKMDFLKAIKNYHE